MHETSEEVAADQFQNHHCDPNLKVVSARLGSHLYALPVPLIVTDREIEEGENLSIAYWLMDRLSDVCLSYFLSLSFPYGEPCRSTGWRYASKDLSGIKAEDACVDRRGVPGGSIALLERLSWQQVFPRTT